MWKTKIHIHFTKCRIFFYNNYNLANVQFELDYQNGFDSQWYDILKAKDATT